MASTYPTDVRTDNDSLDSRAVLLLSAYAGGIIATIAVATGAAALLAGFTTGLGQFVLVAAGWIAVVSASPEIAERGTKRLAELEFAQRAPRSARAVHTVVSYFVAR